MRLYRLVGWAALALAAGCSSMSYNPLKWIGVIKDPENMPRPLTPAGSSVKVHSVWTAAVGKSGPYALRPAISSGRLYAANAEGVITVTNYDSNGDSYDVPDSRSAKLNVTGSNESYSGKFDVPFGFDTNFTGGTDASGWHLDIDRPIFDIHVSGTGKPTMQQQLSIASAYFAHDGW